MSFWGELKRRNVYKVGVAYAIVAWLIIQAVSITFPVLHLPGWAVTLVTVLVIIGFPFALLFAWAFEVTPEGLKRTRQVPLEESITHLTGKKLNYILAGSLVLAIGFLLFDNYYLDRRTIEPVAVSTGTEEAAVGDEEKAKKTIAVLPFVNLSSDPEQEYFVDGLSEEIISSLTQIPNLGVTGRTSSFTFKGSNKKTQEIANELGVENILEGSVRKAGNSLRITAQLVRAKDDLHLCSKTYDRELKDIFTVQEDIATAVAEELKVTLGIDKSLKQSGGTENVEAYEHYLIAKGQMWSEDVAVMNHTLESIDAAINIDPEFALAWAVKAHMHAGLMIFGPADRSATELNAGLQAARRAIELAPNLPDAYAVLGWLKMSRGNWIEAGSAFRKALAITTEQLTGYGIFYPAIHYQIVGNFKRAHELLEEARWNDPIHQNNRAQYMLNFSFLGDIKKAEEEYECCRALFGIQWFLGNQYITCIRLGSGDTISRDDIVYSNPIFNAAKEHLDTPKEGLDELHQLDSDDNNLSESDMTYISIWAAYFGDPEFAMDAMEKGIRISGTGLFKIWLPVFQEVRQTPRFKEFIREIGLVDYWNEFGWPDICHELDNGDFECD